MPTLLEEFNALSHLVERTEAKPKSVKPDRVWGAIKRRIQHHQSMTVKGTQDGIRELRGEIKGEAARGKVTKAMDALMRQYGASPSMKRSKWEGGRQVIRSYRNDGRYVAMMRLKEKTGDGGPMWLVTISVPKR
jgi:hypothetical protein